MKLLIVLIFAVLGAQAAVVKSSPRANLYAGYIYAGDVLLHRSYVYRAAQVNTLQTENVTFVGNFTTIISAVQAQEVGVTQYASAFIVGGGIRQNNVTVRFQSSYGGGYYYLLSIWGR